MSGLCKTTLFFKVGGITWSKTFFGQKMNFNLLQSATILKN